MPLLIAGVLLWSIAHLFKRLAPGPRASLGAAGKGGIAILIVASLVLMTLGYQHASGSYFWGRSPAMVGVNNLLMLLAVYLMVAAVGKTWVTRVVRHPQLTAVKAWAVGHILVNGDVPSLVLFGGLLAWAVVSVIVINRQDGKPPVVIATSAGKEVVAGVGAILTFAGISFVHIYFGYPVFG